MHPLFPRRYLKGVCEVATFIYGLECPITKVVRYIGKAENPKARFINHLTTARTGRLKHHNARWIRNLLQRGLSPALKILAEVRDGERWQDVERRFIADALREGLRLTNTCAGGEGADYLDSRKRAEVTAKQSSGVRKAWADPVKRQRFIDGARDPAVLARRSETARRRNADPIYKAKQSEALKRTRGTPEARAAQSVASRRLHADRNTKARHSAALLAAYRCPEAKANLAAAMAEVNARPEVRAAKSARMKSKWDEPEYRVAMHTEPVRAKMSASQKDRFAKPAERDRLLALARDPLRNAKNAEIMKVRNADPAFRAKVSDPEVRARAAATLRETWARRKRERRNNQPKAA